MSRAPLLAFLLAALLAAPAPASADDGAVAELSATRLAADAAQVTGALAAFESALGVGSLAFGGRSVEVVVEEETGRAYAGVYEPGSYQAGPAQRSEHADVGEATATLRDGHNALIYPLHGQAAPAIVPEARCAALLPSPREEVRPQPHIKDPDANLRHPQRFDVRDTLAWDLQDCAVSAWALNGSFEVRLFEADATIQGETYASGHSEEGTGELPTGDNATEERTDRYVFLVVRDGWLRATGAPAVFLSAAEVRADRVVLEGASGTVAALGETGLQGEAVELTGDLTAKAVEDGGSLDVRVTGRVEGGSIGGRAVTVATPGEGGLLDTNLWLAALVAVPVLAGGGAAAWRGGPARRLARLDRHGQAGHDDVVLAGGRRLQRHADLTAEVTALRVEAYVRSGRHAEALAEARRLGGWEGALAAAYVHATAGQADAAVEALRPWQAANALAIGLALRQPAFAAVRAHPEAARWLQGGPA